MAQQRILEADDLQADLAANSALAEHVRGCQACQQLVARLEHLAVAAIALPVGPGGAGGAEGPSADFLARVARLETPDAPLAKIGPAPRSRGLWARRAAAAAIVLAVGLLALSLCLFSGNTARGDTLLADLAAWNLQISQTTDAAGRKAVYEQRVAELKQRLEKATLSTTERQLAQDMLDNADKQVQENDPLAAAQRMSNLAAQVQALQTGASGADRRTTLDAAYRDLTQGVQLNLKAVDPGKLTPAQQEQWQQLQRTQPIVPTSGAMRHTPTRSILAGGGYGGGHGAAYATGGPVLTPKVVVLQASSSPVGSTKAETSAGGGTAATGVGATRTPVPAASSGSPGSTAQASASSQGAETQGSVVGQSTANAAGTQPSDGDGLEDWPTVGGKRISVGTKNGWHVTHGTKKKVPPGTTPGDGSEPPKTVAITDPSVVTTDALWRAEAVAEDGAASTGGPDHDGTGVSDSTTAQAEATASALVLHPLKQILQPLARASGGATSASSDMPITLPDPWNAGQQNGLADGSVLGNPGAGPGAMVGPSTQGAPEPATWLLVLAGATVVLMLRGPGRRSRDARVDLDLRE